MFLNKTKQEIKIKTTKTKQGILLSFFFKSLSPIH